MFAALSGILIANKCGNVERQLFVRLADLGLGWVWLFHLWQKTILLAADGGWAADDGGVVLCRISLADVFDFAGANCCSLFSPQARLLMSGRNGTKWDIWLVVGQSDQIKIILR